METLLNEPNPNWWCDLISALPRWELVLSVTHTPRYGGMNIIIVTTDAVYEGIMRPDGQPTISMIHRMGGW